jgi:GNAT superfamily N-acetyltransferase
MSATLNSFSIRETNEDDLEEILRHRREMFGSEKARHPAEVLDTVVRTSRPFIQKTLKDGSYRGWFAVAPDGRVAAGAGLLITPWVSNPYSPEQTHRAYLLNVYTYPQFRKHGLARMLTQTAIDWCREHGFNVLWLHASEFGRPLYESLGFEPTNEMKLRIE